jgi:hypothetical protein
MAQDRGLDWVKNDSFAGWRCKGCGWARPCGFFIGPAVSDHKEAVAAFDLHKCEDSPRDALVTKFRLGDRVRIIGTPAVRIVLVVREMPGSETQYWAPLGSDSPARAWAKESELELAD